VLSEAKPLVKPGTLLAYHAVSGGFILGEIVHRVCGRDTRALHQSLQATWMRLQHRNLGICRVHHEVGFQTHGRKLGFELQLDVDVASG